MRVCPECNEPMYFTGEFNPTATPQRWYADKNFHIMKFSESGDPDWGDYSVTNQFRLDVKTRASLDKYRVVDAVNWT